MRAIVPVDADAHLMKAQIQQQLLCPVDHCELLLADRLAVGEAGGETGERLLVPRRQTQPVGELTDLGITQLHVPQRIFYAQLPAPATRPGR